MNGKTFLTSINFKKVFWWSTTICKNEFRAKNIHETALLMRICHNTFALSESCWKTTKFIEDGI